jgi:hypothetical protein
MPPKNSASRPNTILRTMQQPRSQIQICRRRILVKCGFCATILATRNTRIADPRELNWTVSSHHYACKPTPAPMRPPKIPNKELSPNRLSRVCPNLTGALIEGRVRSLQIRQKCQGRQLSDFPCADIGIVKGVKIIFGVIWH